MSWQAVLLSLQRLKGCSVHLGGESALDFAGHLHYLSLGGTRCVHFYGDAPSWLQRLPTTERIDLGSGPRALVPGGGFIRRTASPFQSFSFRQIR